MSIDDKWLIFLIRRQLSPECAGYGWGYTQSLVNTGPEVLAAGQFGPVPYIFSAGERVADFVGQFLVASLVVRQVKEEGADACRDRKCAWLMEN